MPFNLRDTPLAVIYWIQLPEFLPAHPTLTRDAAPAPPPQLSIPQDNKTPQHTQLIHLFPTISSFSFHFHLQPLFHLHCASYTSNHCPHSAVLSPPLHFLCAHILHLAQQTELLQTPFEQMAHGNLLLSFATSSSEHLITLVLYTLCILQLSPEMRHFPPHLA